MQHYSNDKKFSEAAPPLNQYTPPSTSSHTHPGLGILPVAVPGKPLEEAAALGIPPVVVLGMLQGEAVVLGILHMAAGLGSPER